MARFARVVAPGIPHHITQRGNARQFILDRDADRAVYLQLLRQYCGLHHLALAGYCLMSNHVHLIAVPDRADSLHLALKHAHGRYAAYWNAVHASSGHVWQGRFYSCPLDESHLWAALRYTELNPVRAGLVPCATDYVWSSARVHAGDEAVDACIDLHLADWRRTWTPEQWLRFLAEGTPASEAEHIRGSTHTGRPLGAREFIRSLETKLKRRLAPEVGGRPPKHRDDNTQTALGFSA